MTGEGDRQSPISHCSQTVLLVTLAARFAQVGAGRPPSVPVGSSTRPRCQNPPDGLVAIKNHYHLWSDKTCSAVVAAHLFFSRRALAPAPFFLGSTGLVPTQFQERQAVVCGFARASEQAGAAGSQLGFEASLRGPCPLKACSRALGALPSHCSCKKATANG